VVDAYAGLIPRWGCSLVKDAAFVECALRHAAARFNKGGRLIEPDESRGHQLTHEHSNPQVLTVPR
jgi:hypothetical protein